MFINIISLLVVFVFLFLFFFPLGNVISVLVKPKLSPAIEVSSSLGFSVLLYVLLAFFLYALDLPGFLSQVIILTFVGFGLSVWIQMGLYRVVFNRPFLIAYIWWLILFIFVSSWVFSISGNRLFLSYDNFQGLVGESFQNLSYYNSSRMILDSASVGSFDVIPGFSFTDVSPAFGALSSLVFRVFSIQDISHLLFPGGDHFALYYLVTVFFNSYCVLCVSLIAGHYLGSRVAAMTVLLVVFNWFFISSLAFAAPQLICASLILVAFSAWGERGLDFFVGLLLASALLCSYSALFFILSLIFVASIRQIVFRYRLIIQNILVPFFRGMGGVLSILLVITPWFLYSSLHDITFHKWFSIAFFSDGVGGMLKNFNLQNGMLGFLEVRISNIFSPFDFTDSGQMFSTSIFDFGNLIFTFARLSNEKLVYAFGLPIFIVFLFGVFSINKDEKVRPVVWLCLLAYLGMFVYLFMIATKFSAYNYYYLHPVYLLSMMVVSWSLVNSSFVARIFAWLGVVINGLLLLAKLKINVDDLAIVKSLDITYSLQVEMLFLLIFIFFASFSLSTQGKKV